MANKVKYNLRNVYYATVTEADGVYTYGTPVKWPGAVSISLDAEGDTNPFYADGIVYFQTVSNNGYSGDFESALIPNSFRTDILGETLSNGVYIEDATVMAREFALLFQFDGDANAIRHVLYNCKCTRPSIESQTNEDQIEVRTETMELTASPRADGIIKARCEDTTSSAYETWFSAVYVPTSEEP